LPKEGEKTFKVFKVRTSLGRQMELGFLQGPKKTVPVEKKGILIN